MGDSHFLLGSRNKSILQKHSHLSQSPQYHNKLSNMDITHSSHPHELKQENTPIPYLCSGCKEIGLGSCHQCKANKECNFYLHPECAISPFSITHPFSDSCEFTFLKDGSTIGSSCDACGREVKGFRYKCGCNFIKRKNLHPQCSKYQEKYVINGWTLNLSKKISSICLHCEEKGEVKGWGYVSSCGDYCFHGVCLWERLYDDWSKGLFPGINSCDVSEMLRFTIVKLVTKQVQLQRRKHISSGGSVSSGDVATIVSTVTSVLNS